MESLPGGDGAGGAGSKVESSGGASPVALALWRSLALGLLGALAMIGLALAGPERRAEVLVRAAPVACAAQPGLPPGHPPVGGFEGSRAFPALPPGHPPVNGSQARSSRASPLAPVFEAPEILDI